MLRSLILALAFLPLALAGQPLQLTLASRLVNDPNATAILVSNQYGVLRYYKLLEEEQAEDLSFSVNQRLGEQLALTLVRQTEDNGLFAFDNITYRGVSDGAFIDKAEEEEEEGERVYQQVEIFVDGVSAVEEVVVTGPVALQPVYRIIGGRLFVAFSAPRYLGVMVLFKVNQEENYRYLYLNLDEGSRFETSLGGLKPDLTAHRIGLPKDGEWAGAIQAYDGERGQYVWVYNSEQMRKPERQQHITAYLPGAGNLAHFNLELFGSGADGYAFYGRYEALPGRLEPFFFDPLFMENESKAFRFKTSEEEVGHYYEVAYSYTSGQGAPASRWRVYGAVRQAGEVDFILPDIPAELYGVLPELDLLEAPAAAVKRMMRCTRNCDYDFSRKPHLLQSREWRMEHALQARSQETVF